MLAHHLRDHLPRGSGQARCRTTVGHDFDRAVRQQHVDQHARSARGVPHAQLPEQIFRTRARAMPTNQRAQRQARLHCETDFAVVVLLALGNGPLDLLHRVLRKAPGRGRMQQVPDGAHEIHHQLPEAPPPPVMPPPPENPPPPPNPPPPKPPPPNPPPPQPPQRPQRPLRAKAPPLPGRSPTSAPMANPAMPRPTSMPPSRNRAAPISNPLAPARNGIFRRPNTPRKKNARKNPSARNAPKLPPSPLPEPSRFGAGGSGSPSISFASAPSPSRRPP